MSTYFVQYLPTEKQRGNRDSNAGRPREILALSQLSHLAAARQAGVGSTDAAVGTPGAGRPDTAPTGTDRPTLRRLIKTGPQFIRPLLTQYLRNALA